MTNPHAPKVTIVADVDDELVFRLGAIPLPPSMPLAHVVWKRLNDLGGLTNLSVSVKREHYADVCRGEPFETQTEVEP